MASAYFGSVTAIGDASAREVREICALKKEHWPYPLDAQLRWWRENSHQSDQLVRLHDGDEMIAFLRLRDRPLFSADEAVPALCATEVCVRKTRQGRGIGRQLMLVAEAAIGASHAALGYLLCTDAEKSFYVKCGWQVVDKALLRRTVNEQSGPLRENSWCLLHDPDGRAPGAFVIQGDVF